MFSEDGTAAFDAIHDAYPMLGRGSTALSVTNSSAEYGPSTTMPLDRDDLALPGESDVADLQQPRAVRWYNATAANAPPNGTLRGNDGPTLLFLRTQRNTISSIVVVDLNRAAGARLGQLADHIALIVLSNPKMGANFKPEIDHEPL